MSIIDRNIGKCVVCGEKFARQRISKTTCSDRCRQSLNRKKRADSVAVATQLLYARQSIREIKRLMQIGEHSYDAAKAMLLIIQEAVVSQAKVSDDWHCQSCDKIIKEVPGKYSCKCDKPRWILQKTMF